MTDPSEVPPPPTGSSLPKVLASVAVSLVLVVLSIAAVLLIWVTEPEPEREGAVRRTPMLVEVGTPEHGTFRPRLSALGAVRPLEEITLQPRVSGQITSVSPDFLQGKVVDAGATLLRIDPADARQALVQRQSALRQAEAELTLEQGRQAVAKLERDQIVQQLGGTIAPEQEALILREPQLEAAKAAVESAKAAVRQAELELARTVVTAPFRALVLERTAHPGSQVTPATALARLVGVDRFWVELTLPSKQLAHLDVSGGEVPLVNTAAWSPGQQRIGTLESVIGQVDEQTRMARVLVSVDDPLALDEATAGPPLMSGSWLEADLPGLELTNTARIPRGWLRQHRGNPVVWTVVDETLHLQPVTVAVESKDYAYLSEGLDPSATVVTTDLSTVSEGAPLRIAEASK